MMAYYARQYGAIQPRDHANDVLIALCVSRANATLITENKEHMEKGSIARAMVDQQGIMRDHLEAHVRRVLSKEPQCVNRTLDLVRLAERILQKQGGNALVIIVTAFVRGLPEKLANNVIGRV